MKPSSLSHRVFKFLGKTIPDVLMETGAQMKQAHLFMVASSLAYTTILSIIPLLAVSFAIFNAFGGMQKISSTLEPIILSNLAEGASEEVIQILHGFINNTHAGVVGVGGLIGLIVTSMSMLSSAENAINRVWQVRNTRTFMQRMYAYWFFITLGPLALSVAVGTATSSEFPLHRFLPNGAGMFIITIGIFFFVYKWVPNTVVHLRSALISSIVMACFWNFARMGYSFYSKNYLNYHTIYGSLAAVPVLLLWIYIIWIIILVGAALTAAIQKRAGVE